MGLFSKKEACPVCGGEVKGLFLVKIGDKKTLCKSCSKQVSMQKEQLEKATPEFIREHLAYRQKNAETFATHTWTEKYTAIPGFTMGLDEAGQAVYFIHDALGDVEENPVVFSFGQLTGYELYRRKTKLDGMEDTGAIPLETGLSALGAIARLANSDASKNYDTFHLKLTTTDPYWPAIDFKIDFADTQLHGFGGFGGEMQKVCQILKTIARGESLTCVH